MSILLFAPVLIYHNFCFSCPEPFDWQENILLYIMSHNNCDHQIDAERIPSSFLELVNPLPPLLPMILAPIIIYKEIIRHVNT